MHFLTVRYISIQGHGTYKAGNLLYKYENSLLLSASPTAHTLAQAFRHR